MALCHQVCFVRLRIDISNSRLLLLHDILHECTSALHVTSVPTLVSMPMPSQTDCRHGFTRVTAYPNSFKRCFVTIPSVIPADKACSSASAELKLTDCCVRDHAERDAFLHCTNPPLVLLQVMGCPVQSLPVYTFTDCGKGMISIKHVALGTPFQYREMRFMLSSSPSVEQRIFRAVAFTLYVMSARSSHMYNSFPTAVLYAARFSFSSSTSDSVFGVLLTVGVATSLESSRPSTAITSRMYENPRGVHDHSTKKEKLITQPSQSSHNAHHDLIRQEFNQSQKFRHQHEWKYRCQIYRLCNNSDLSKVCGRVIQTFQESHHMLVPQFRCFAISIQICVQCPNFVFTQF